MNATLIKGWNNPPKVNPTHIFALQFLDVARTLEGYGTVVFPHCACDARRHGHVIVSISLKSFRLRACSDQGDTEVSCAGLLFCNQFVMS